MYVYSVLFMDMLVIVCPFQYANVLFLSLHEYFVRKKDYLKKFQSTKQANILFLDTNI